MAWAPPPPLFGIPRTTGPIQFILVLGSVPLRCATRTLGVLSIHRPRENSAGCRFPGPLGFLSGALE